MSETRTFKGVEIEIGDIVSITTEYPHPIIMGAAHHFENGKIFLLTDHEHHFNTDGRYFTENRHAFGIQSDVIKTIKVAMTAEEAIPFMTGSRNYRKDEAVYFQKCFHECIIGNIVLAYNKMVVIKTHMGISTPIQVKSLRKVRTATENSRFTDGESVYRVLDNGDYVSGKVHGLGERGKNLLVQLEKGGIVGGNITEWKKFDE